MRIVDPVALLKNLCSQPRECEWLEFKHNYFDGEEVGKYISALANSAILSNQRHAYIVWGIEDSTHKIVGTSVRIKDQKIGNEIFENWLSRGLDPRINLSFIEFDSDNKHFSIIQIEPAYQRPVLFNKQGYIRVGSATKQLEEQPERHRSLWQVTSKFSFERGIALSHVTWDEISKRFDCESYFRSWKSLNVSTNEMINYFLMEELIIDDRQGRFDVTNLFAILLAKNLDEFPTLREKAPRVIIYKDSTKLHSISDVIGRYGYAITLPRILNFLKERIPQHEEMRHGVRVKEFMYPEISIREFVANALIHQDFTLNGAGPVIELFSNRLQITNPGIPLVPLDRFIDAPSKSRNKHLSKIMRELGLCEERGSGVDRALDAIEKQALPAPIFTQVAESTVVTLLKERDFADMTKEDRIRACYQHACLRHQSGDAMSNGSLRQRFGLNEKQYPQVSAVIQEAILAGKIVPNDPNQSNRFAKYVPHWSRDIPIM